MDPITLILEALTAGAVASLKDTAGKAINDGYEALKLAIKKAWSASDNSADVILTEYEKDPETFHKPVEIKIKGQGLDQNEEIIALASALLKQTDPDGYVAGKYRVSISNSNNVQVGDRNTQINVKGDAHTGSGNFNKTVYQKKD